MAGAFPVETGDDVSIGPEAVIITLGHDPRSTDFADLGGPVRICDHAWVACRAIVLPNVTIGEGAIVAAGAVVTRNVAPFTIVAGAPARPVGERRRDLTYRLNFDPSLI
jgi:acetyltransferase-like isoleucine patch superfamily enzyme